MFTGIVQTTAAIRESHATDTGRRLTIERGSLRGEIHHGDSICVSGVCLTAVDIRDDRLSFDVIHETLSKTTLGALAVGDRVNLEPAVTPNQPLGGHFMQGHVDGLAVVDQIHTDGGEWRITFRPEKASPLQRDGEPTANPFTPLNLMDSIIPRGSIAIEGVSLTLARVAEDAFDVALIPTTLEMTTLGALRPGSRVNIEADILAKTVIHQLRRMQGGSGTDGTDETNKPRHEPVTMDLLRKAGFLAQHG